MGVLLAPNLLEKSGLLNDLMILITSGILNVFSTLMLLGCPFWEWGVDVKAKMAWSELPLLPRAQKGW